MKRPPMKKLKCEHCEVESAVDEHVARFICGMCVEAGKKFPMMRQIEMPIVADERELEDVR